MEHEASQSSPNGRTRYLNIVYFVESARSHTIRINLRYARWAVGAGILVLSWAIGSIVWITTLDKQIRGTRQRLEYSLATLFDYQIKNDKVFDLAYPSEATESYYSESAQLSSNSPVVEKARATTVPEPQHVVKASATPVENPTAPALNTAATENKAAPAPTPKSNEKILIAVNNSKISKIGNKISLVFDINNHNPEKAEGYIWAVAEITEGNGRITYVAAPEHTKIDPANGDLKSIKTAYRFSIQRFKNKSFDFKVPSTQEWKLTKLTVYFAAVDGSNGAHTEIPVDQMALINFKKIQDKKIWF